MHFMAGLLAAAAVSCFATDLVSVRQASGVRPIVIGDFDRVVPQVVDGGGWKTTLILTNLDTKPVNWVVFFTDDNGE